VPLGRRLDPDVGAAGGSLVPGCDHRYVQDEQAWVLAREGNVAIVQLTGRKFPGVHVQGDTFAELRRQLADTVGRMQCTSTDGDVIDELDDVVQQMTEMLRLYEATLHARGMPRLTTQQVNGRRVPGTRLACG
jgi:hypothetical protein